MLRLLLFVRWALRIWSPSLRGLGLSGYVSFSDVVRGRVATFKKPIDTYTHWGVR